MRYRNRTHAGESMVEPLLGLGLREPVVLGIARGGVVVAAAVARGLGAALDVLVAFKLGAPDSPDRAIGAVADGPAPTLYLDAMARTIAPDQFVLDEASREFDEIARLEEVFRAGRPHLDLSGRDVVVIDDGVATGWTIRAALRAARDRRPARLVAATPVGPPGIEDRLSHFADDVVCQVHAGPYGSVESCYESFGRVSETEVVLALAEARRRINTATA